MDIMEACQARRKSPNRVMFPRLRFRPSITKGMSRKARPPHIRSEMLTGRATTAPSPMPLMGSGTVAQVGKRRLTHISAFASAPPWSRRNLQAKSMRRMTEKSEAVFHHSMPNGSPSLRSTSNGVVDWYSKAPATTPIPPARYHNKNERSIHEPLIASPRVGRPKTETLA